MTLPWVRTAPLGMPVVPPVNWIMAGSSGLTSTLERRVEGVFSSSSEKCSHPSSRSRLLAELTGNPLTKSVTAVTITRGMRMFLHKVRIDGSAMSNVMSVVSPEVLAISPSSSGV